MQRVLAVLLVSAVLAPRMGPDQVAPVRFRLSNGLRVILRPIQGAARSAIVVHFDIGGNMDPPGRSGMAHLIEHVYCTSPAGATPARTAEEWMAAGGNAQTGEDYTIIADQFESARMNEVLADAVARMHDLKPDESLLNREKDRLAKEVDNMFGGIPSLAATNLAREHIRPAPNGGRRGGLPQEVARTTLAEIKERWSQYYRPANATIVLAGEFDPQELRGSIEQKFGSLSTGKKSPPLAAPAPGKPAGTKIAKVRAASPGASSEACVAFAAPAPSAADFAPFLLLAIRLMVASPELGAKPGERFPPCVQYAILEDPAVIEVGGPVKPGETPDDAIKRIRAFVAKTVAKPITDVDRQATRFLVGALLGLVNLPDQQWALNPYALGLSLIRRDRMGFDPVKVNQTLDRLTDADLQRTAKTTFSPGGGAAVVAVPNT